MKRQPWIGPAWFDLAFILLPGVVVSLAVLAAPQAVTNRAVSPLLWGALIVGVDVTHVYTTLYRTYFDPAEFRRGRTLYLVAPLLGFLVFAGLYSLGAMVFWRCLAYLAAFHFVRQQYGFMMLYGRRERRHRWIDQTAIYAATLYPLAWWHLHPRQFSWFIDGDFLGMQAPVVASDLLLAVYVAIMAIYVVKEALLVRQEGAFNWPRNLLLVGTALSWWVGIIALDSDLAFTAVNVLAHGIPYTALIWLYGRNQARLGAAGRLLGIVPGARLFTLAAVPLFLLVPLLLAYLEEGLWDGMVWQDHPGLFPAFTALPTVQSNAILVWLVPLLALPQITHYVLDAFIWRLKQQGTPWRARLLLRDRAV